MNEQLANTFLFMTLVFGVGIIAASFCIFRRIKDFIKKEIVDIVLLPYNVRLTTCENEIERIKNRLDKNESQLQTKLDKITDDLSGIKTKLEYLAGKFEISLKLQKNKNNF